MTLRRLGIVVYLIVVMCALFHYKSGVSVTHPKTLLLESEKSADGNHPLCNVELNKLGKRFTCIYLLAQYFTHNI